MSMQLVTGNHAAGHAFGLAGEANRTARGAVCGIYPITPQTEIVEYVAKFSFSKGAVVPVESEHSAMGVCLGAAMNGARSFTASSSNGLAYMAENVMVASFYRLPIVMAVVNRTLGPPWNIWADQGDSLMFRDFAWIQLYCETSQDVADTSLLAFRLAEDPRIMLPVMVCMDGFIISHTSMEVELAEQEQVDRFLPPCNVPHKLDFDQPKTMGGMTFPQETVAHRHELQEAMGRVPAVFEEHRERFRDVFDRDLAGAVEAYCCEDADTIFVTSGSISTTMRDVIDKRRERGDDKVGMVAIKMFRPFPVDRIRELCAGAKKVGVLDRNCSADRGGIFWQEIRAAMQGGGHPLIQGYLTGVGGCDVIPKTVHEVVDDLLGRSEAGEPVWKGV
ncbi:MAG: pyruvate ferredoxin oxidoreductase [Gammaproteobacteria bacterium]|nr:pyruvate ferredoxin oxidoreductase [Gammaproteobacteria bacterium]